MPQALAAARFQAKISRTDGCWLWIGATDRNGYGWYKHDGRMDYAHRLVAAEAFGPLAPGVLVCHHCDNPSCVRPDHLFLGSNADNMADMVAKGRQNHGDEHWTRTQPDKVRHGSKNQAAVLVESQVIEIRNRYRSGEKQIPLAVRFGVSQGLISQIVRRVIWTHVKEAA